MNNESVKNLIIRHQALAQTALTIFNRLPLNNSLSGAKAETGLSYLKGCKIQNHGKNNIIRIGDFSRLIHCTIQIYGNDNVISIGDYCTCNEAVFWLEDNCSRIQIGDHTRLSGSIQLSAIEGTEIRIGNDCLFSSDIDIRNGDSHSLVRNGTRERINPSEPVVIGDHVWVGKGVTILKGTIVPDNCVVGAASLLCKPYKTANCVLAGVPAKEVKQDINWLNERI